MLEKEFPSIFTSVSRMQDMASGQHLWEMFSGDFLKTWKNLTNKIFSQKML